MPNNTNITNLLISEANANEWKDWLFHIQSTLIATGYCEGLTEKGRNDFSAKFQSLYDTFSKLD